MEFINKMMINKDTKAIDLYDFIKQEMSFDEVIELAKLINYKITTGEDEPRYNKGCSFCEDYVNDEMIKEIKEIKK